MPIRTEAEWEVYDFPRESGLQTYILNRVKQHTKAFGKRYIKMWKASDQHTAGVSDLIGCVCGTFVALELKVGKNKATALQEYFIEEIHEAGGIASVCYNWGTAKRILNRILSRNNAPPI